MCVNVALLVQVFSWKQFNFLAVSVLRSFSLARHLQTSHPDTILLGCCTVASWPCCIDDYYLKTSSASPLCQLCLGQTLDLWISHPTATFIQERKKNIYIS